MGFSRQEYWSGLPFPPPGDLPDLGIKPAPFMSPALAGVFFTTNFTWEVPHIHTHIIKCSLEILIEEGNGTPLQYSCLENSMYGGAWWAAVHGVTHSHT